MATSALSRKFLLKLAISQVLKYKDSLQPNFPSEGILEVAALSHYNDVIMGAMVSQITSVSIVYSTVYSGADQRKHINLRVTGLCVGNSPVTGEFPAQMASNAENVSIWWRHYV